MNSSNVFRHKESGRILTAISYLLLCAIFGSMLLDWPYFDGLSDRFAVGDYPSIWSILGFLFLASMVFLEIWLFLNIGLFVFHYKVTLTGEAIEIQSRDFFLRKFFNGLNNGYFLGSILYENIKFIDTVFWKPGIGKITLRNGETVLVGIRSLENHNGFIKLLKEKLDQAQIGDGVEKLARPKRFGVLQTALIITALLPTVFLMAEMYFRDNFTYIWNEELSAWGIQSIATDTDGSIWASAYNRDSDNYVWHLAENTREHWTLPQKTCENCLRLYTTHNGKNQPVVIDRVATSIEEEPKAKVFVWNGINWDQSVIDGDFFDDEGGNAYGPTIWGTQGNNLVQVNFSTGQRVEFPFPEFVISSQLRLLDIKINPDGSLLTLFSAEYQPEYIYLFSNGKWNEPILFDSESELILAFCLDEQGNVWAMTSDFDGSWHIGFYDPAESSWNWTDLQPGEPDRRVHLLYDIAVDSYDRIWVAGIYDQQAKHDHYMIFVSVFQRNGEQLLLLEEYTDRNSNIYDVKQIVTTENRVWVKGRDLYWVGAQTQKLPSPLPDWIVWGFEIIDTNFGWIFIILIVQFALLFLAQSLEYK